MENKEDFRGILINLEEFLTNVGLPDGSSELLELVFVI